MEAKTVEQKEQVTSEVIEKATPAKKEKDKRPKYLVNARWEHPHFAGIPMPRGVSFYGFVTFTVRFSKYPTANQLKKLALAKGAEDRGLTIESISVVPASYKV